MQYVLGNMLNGGGINPDGLSLDLQFAADKTLTARRGPTPVFTRGSTGTFVGSNGLIQTAAVNAPRFDHDPVTGVCKGLLIEEGRTNVALYSGALVIGTGWATDVTPGTTSTVSGVGPDGNNAYEIAETAVNFSHAIINTGGTGGTGATSITSGITYTGSIFLKKIAGSIDWIQLTFAGAGFGTTGYANINLSTGAIGNSNGGTARVEAHANGWYKVSWTSVATVTTTTASNLIVVGNQNTNGTTRAPSYAGDTANKFLAAMCQFEAGSFATSYIPTTTAPLTRGADVCGITGGDFNNFYNQSEGTAVTKVTNAAGIGSLTQYPFSFSGSSANELLIVYRSGSSAITPRACRFGSIVLNNDTLLDSPDAGVFADNAISIAGFAIKLNDFAGSLNGNLITDTTVSLPAVDRMFIGNRVDGTRTWNGHIAYIRYYKKRLPNAKLQALTV
jgi:hypothetical protein